jgi:hypothetical protein
MPICVGLMSSVRRPSFDIGELEIKAVAPDEVARQAAEKVAALLAARANRGFDRLSFIPKRPSLTVVCTSSMTPFIRLEILVLCCCVVLEWVVSVTFNSLEYKI